MKPLGKSATNSLRRLKVQPRYTTIHWPVAEKFELSASEYSIIDSIHKLSHRPDHPWCTESKERLGSWVRVSRRTVFTAIEKGLVRELVEKNERGDLRSTDKWIMQVELYERTEDWSNQGCNFCTCRAVQAIQTSFGIQEVGTMKKTECKFCTRKCDYCTSHSAEFSPLNNICIDKNNKNQRSKMNTGISMVEWSNYERRIHHRTDRGWPCDNIPKTTAGHSAGLSSDQNTAREARNSILSRSFIKLDTFPIDHNKGAYSSILSLIWA